MTLTRRNAWNNGGTFNNLDLLWYAKAVGVMKSRPISDPTSWWFYAAIHGEYLITPTKDPDGEFPVDTYPNWKYIESIPATANLNNLPPKLQTLVFWDQCQHGTWFFLPWHRGYLAAIEIILRDIIENDLHGPSDWALPYWDYLKDGQANIPPAFTAESLPDGSPNPLYVKERYGVKGDSVIAIQQTGKYAINETCQSLTNDEDYLGADTEPPGFSHDGGNSGGLERNPHNKVHVQTGGFNGIDLDKDPDKADGSLEGLMADPSTAALDPIFYIHHCNIDRMWAAWIETGGNQNPTEDKWLQGPDTMNDRAFAMPIDNAGTPWIYTPEDVSSTVLNYYDDTKYAYTFDDLSLTSGAHVALATTMAQRLINLGIDGGTENIKTKPDQEPELVGASNSFVLNSGTTEVGVQVDQAPVKAISRSLTDASATKLPDEVYLKLENITGIQNANMLAVFVNDIFVDSVALFGLRAASRKNSKHGGAGLSFKFNISHIIDQLHMADKNLGDLNNLSVKIETSNSINGEIKVGRISIYRVNQ